MLTAHPSRAETKRKILQYSKISSEIITKIHICTYLRIKINNYICYLDIILIINKNFLFINTLIFSNYYTEYIST